MNSPIQKALLVFLLWFAGLGAAAQFAKIAVPFAPVQALYPDTGPALGWLLSLVSFVGAILGVVAGGLVGRVGARNLLLFGLLLGALVSVWQSLLPDFPLMLVSRVVEGVSHLAIVVAAPTIIAEIAPERFRGAAMALWSSFFGVSFALVAWLGLPLVKAGGLDALFAAHGVFLTTIAAILLFSLKNEKQASSGASERATASVLARHLTAYRSPRISAPGIGWLFYTLTFVSLLAILPQQMPDGQGAWVAGAMPLVSVAVSLFLVPVLLQSFTSVRLVIFGFLGGILVVVAALAGLPLAVVAVALFAVLGLVQGASFSAVPELNDSMEDRALAYGVMAQLGNVGNLLGTPLYLAILGAAGQSTMFAGVVLVYILAITAHLILERRRSVDF